MIATVIPLKRIVAMKNCFGLAIGAIVLLIVGHSVADAQDNASQIQVTGGRVSIGIMGLSRSYPLFDFESSGSVIFRKVKGDKDKYTFTEFKIAELQTDELVREFRKLVEKQEPEIRGGSWHGPILLVDVRYKSAKNSAIQGSFSKQFGYDGMPFEYFCVPWSDLISATPENDADLTERLGPQLRKVSELSLNFSGKDSKVWKGDRCRVDIPVIRPGSNGHENWKYPLEFADAITPTEFSFTTKWNEMLRTQPDGIVDLGKYYGYYQISPVIEHPNHGK